MANMTQEDLIAGELICSNGQTMDTGETVTLIGAGPGKVQAIYMISLHAAGTISAFSISVFRNDGTTIISKFGGQTLNAAQTLGPYVWNFNLPILCIKNDNAKVTITATGATADTVHCSVGYKILAA